MGLTIHIKYQVPSTKHDEHSNLQIGPTLVIIELGPKHDLWLFAQFLFTNFEMR